MKKKHKFSIITSPEILTVSLPPLNPNNFSVPQSIVCPDELLCTEVEVFNLISSIDMTKSNGLDGISARMLKATVGSITLAVTKLFNMSIKSGKLPNEWKLALVTPKPKPSNKSDPANLPSNIFISYY